MAEDSLNHRQRQVALHQLDCPGSSDGVRRTEIFWETTSHSTFVELPPDMSLIDLEQRTPARGKSAVGQRLLNFRDQFR